MSRTNHIFGMIVFTAIAAALIFPASRAAYGLSEDAVNTLGLESRLEERLKSVLTEIIGTEKVIVLVSVDSRAESGKRQDAVLLPGVPIRKEAGNEQSFAFKTTIGKALVKKLSVTVLLDAEISESIKETVRDVTASVLGMNSARGDELYVRQIDFKDKGFSWSSLFSAPNLYFLALSVAAGAFFITATLFLLNPFKRLPAVLKNVDWDVVRGNGANRTVRDPGSGFEGEARMAATAAFTKERTDREQDATFPFSFIQERHIPDLSFLLKKSSPRDVATVANYLGPELGRKLLSGFPDEKQVEIALCLDTEEIDADRIRALEESIKSRLDYVIGGERRLVSLLDMADDNVRDKVLKQVEARDRAAADRLRKETKDLETLLRELPQTAIPVLCRNLDAVLFAQVLRTLPDDIRTRVAASLSRGAAERLQQEMDFSRPLSAMRLKKEKRDITLAIRRMLSDGLIEKENS